MQLAEACGWTSSGRIANYESDLREPANADWVRIAQALGVPAGWLQFGEEHASTNPPDYNVADGPEIGRFAPLISWVKAGTFHEPIDQYSVGDAEDWYPLPRKAGPRTFALRVRGVSMEPRYREGEIIFVDPDAEARHGHRVVVRRDGDKEATFKELVIEGDRSFLKALNPGWPEPLIPINDDATICGVVIGKWTPE